MINQCTVFLKMIMGMGSSHPVIYILTMLIDVSEEVNTRLYVQARHQTMMMASIQTEFNESLRKVFTSDLPVSWNRLETLTRTLATGHV